MKSKLTQNIRAEDTGALEENGDERKASLLLSNPAENYKAETHLMSQLKLLKDIDF